jgi:hypothetical protein
VGSRATPSHLTPAAHVDGTGQGADDDDDDDDAGDDITVDLTYDPCTGCPPLPVGGRLPAQPLLQADPRTGITAPREGSQMFGLSHVMKVRRPALPARAGRAEQAALCIGGDTCHISTAKAPYVTWRPPNNFCVMPAEHLPNGAVPPEAAAGKAGGGHQRLAGDREGLQGTCVYVCVCACACVFACLFA